MHQQVKNHSSNLTRAKISANDEARRRREKQTKAF
jgi:hypothetical protein